MTDLLNRLLENRPRLLADGATGTNLFEAGLQTGYPPELWNLESENQEKVYNLNRAFVAAGADIILTNSFGGTRARLKLHQAEDRVDAANESAARLARRAADGAGRPVVVAGAIGPTGELFEPLGPLTFDEGVEIFAEQAIALKAGGADVLWIETMFSIDEFKSALAGAGRTGLPCVCTLSFDMKGRTMMGVSPAEAARLMSEVEPRPVAYGANCGVGAAEVVAVLLSMKDAAGADDVLVAKSNCGIPQMVGGEVRYSGTPELMSDYVHMALDAGARIVGGCCGTTPGHLKAMRIAMDSHIVGARPDLTAVIARLGEVSPGAQKQARALRPVA
ncbi:MAG: betaine--homocysteine S-methyltransferase [Roseiarcus sp.]